MNANDPFLESSGVVRPDLKRNVFGAKLDGSLKKDKQFFFLSYQVITWMLPPPERPNVASYIDV